MKLKPSTIAIHALVWVLLLVIPYVSTDQIFNLFDPASNLKYLLLCFVLSSASIIVFYFNYIYLIPRFLVTKKFGLYFLFLVLAIAVLFLLSGALFYFSGFSPGELAKKNPAIEKAIPVIIVNAILLWLLSIMSSILWSICHRLKQSEVKDSGHKLLC